MSVHPMVWFAVTCRPLGERAVVDALRERKFDVYLPLETRLRRTAKGPKTVEHPLVPSLIFVGVKSWQDLWPLRQIASIQGVVSLNGRPHPIPSAFVYHLMACQAAGDFDATPRRERFDQGQKVRVLSGPFQEHIGKVVATAPDGRVAVFLEGKFVKGEVRLEISQIELTSRAA